MKIEILNETYLIESIITIAALFLCSFLGLFIGKEWYKSLKKMFKRK
ncbi:MAG: hypothetical protein PHE54_00910 [Bacilli bacterium]|nr:hypothetical protein [Bacilli bacterium]